jgi:hypothetical protein
MELLGIAVQGADADHDGTGGVRALHSAVQHRPLDGDVVGQGVQPDGVVGSEGGIATGQISWRGFLGLCVARDGHRELLLRLARAVAWARPVAVAPPAGAETR